MTAIGASSRSCRSKVRPATVLTRSVVKIPPALTLFVILGVGAVFGVYGVFFAGALLVVTFVAVRELYLRDTLGEDLEGLPEDAKK